MKTDNSLILIRPHITEKATFSAESSVYVFKVHSTATKDSIAKVFQEKYNATPIKVSTVTIPAKKVVVRGKRGVKSGYKKAYIHLKKGEKIEII